MVAQVKFMETAASFRGVGFSRQELRVEVSVYFNALNTFCPITPQTGWHTESASVPTPVPVLCRTPGKRLASRAMMSPSCCNCCHTFGRRLSEHVAFMHRRFLFLAGAD